MKIVESSMRFRVVEMTPEFAQELLDKNHPRNRRPKKSKVEQYVRDIESGLWRLTHQAIAIDEDGYTVDGQNRLAAIIRADKPVPIVLCTGVPRNAILGADCGSPRNVADAAKISGQPLPHGQMSFAGVARRMAIGLEKTKNSMTIQETLAFVKEHEDALDFAFQVTPRNTRILTQSSVRAVLARAWYKRNKRSRIKEFAEVLMSGLMGHTSRDTAAIRLRNWLLDTMGTRRGGARPNAKIVYAKTETALAAFLNDEQVDRLNETSKELFPLEYDEVDDTEAA